MESLPHLEIILVSIKDVELGKVLQLSTEYPRIIGKDSSPNKKFTSQKVTHNKIDIVSANLYHDTFYNSDQPEILTQCRSICLGTLGKNSA
jgi:hypothetical protein